MHCSKQPECHTAIVRLLYQSETWDLTQTWAQKRETWLELKKSNFMPFSSVYTWLHRVFSQWALLPGSEEPQPRTQTAVFRVVRQSERKWKKAIRISLLCIIDIYSHRGQKNDKRQSPAWTYNLLSAFIRRALPHSEANPETLRRSLHCQTVQLLHMKDTYHLITSDCKYRMWVICTYSLTLIPAVWVATHCVDAILYTPYYLHCILKFHIMFYEGIKK